MVNVNVLSEIIDIINKCKSCTILYDDNVNRIITNTTVYSIINIAR